MGNEIYKPCAYDRGSSETNAYYRGVIEDLQNNFMTIVDEKNANFKKIEHNYNILQEDYSSLQKQFAERFKEEITDNNKYLIQVRDLENSLRAKTEELEFSQSQIKQLSLRILELQRGGGLTILKEAKKYGEEEIEI